MGRSVPPDVRFRQLVRDERRQRDWSQEELANRLRHEQGIELHPTAIAKIEAGDRSVRIEEAVAIANVFDVSLDLLVGRETGEPDADLAWAARSLQSLAMKSVNDLQDLSDSLSSLLDDVGYHVVHGDESPEDRLMQMGQSTLNALDVARFELFKLATGKAPRPIKPEEPLPPIAPKPKP